MNRHYGSQQGRFNQVDPLGMGAVSLDDPQSLNLYNYTQNDPINLKDSTGLYSEHAMFVDDGGWGGGFWGGGGGGGTTCYIDGIQSSCGMAFRLLESGAGVIGPENTTRWNSKLNNGEGGWEHFTVDAQGTARWGYFETHELSTSIEGDKTTWKETHWRTTSKVGTLTEWKGQLAFIGGPGGHSIRDFNGNRIGTRGLEMQMLGPLDGIGAGGIKGGVAVAGVLGLGARGLLSAGARYLAKGFAPGQLESHFAKHAAEWGAGNITKIGYLKRAQSLLGRDVGGDILGKVRVNGDVLRYNIRTNEFAVGAAGGTIRTLFRPQDGLAYWLKQ